MKKQILKKALFDAASDMLNETGNKVLEQLERMNDVMHSRVRNKYPYYSNMEKLNWHITHTQGAMRVIEAHMMKALSSVDPVAFLSSRHEIEWLDLDLNTIKAIEQTLKSYLADMKMAKELLIAEQIDKKILSLNKKKSCIDSQIKELQESKKNIENAA